MVPSSDCRITLTEAARVPSETSSAKNASAVAAPFRIDFPEHGIEEHDGTECRNRTRAAMRNSDHRCLWRQRKDADAVVQCSPTARLLPTWSQRYRHVSLQWQLKKTYYTAKITASRIVGTGMAEKDARH